MRGRTKKILIPVFLVIGVGLCVTGIFMTKEVAIALISAGSTSIGGALLIAKMLFTKGHDTPPDSIQEPTRQTTITLPTEREVKEPSIAASKPSIIIHRRNTPPVTPYEGKRPAPNK